MNESRIDETILSNVGAHWTKVAMVIVSVADAMGRELPTGNERYQMVSKHIEALVSDGRLVAQGDTKNWRHSEVCLPGAHPQGT
jgi:hypothetical protein